MKVNHASPQVLLGPGGSEFLNSEITAAKLSRQARVSEAHVGTNALISTSLATCARCPDRSGVRRHSEEKSGHVLPSLGFNLLMALPVHLLHSSWLLTKDSIYPWTDTPSWHRPRLEVWASAAEGFCHSLASRKQSSKSKYICLLVSHQSRKKRGNSMIYARVSTSNFPSTSGLTECVSECECFDVCLHGCTCACFWTRPNANASCVVSLCNGQVSLSLSPLLKTLDEH